ncbi:DUF6531 domain-containing protein [Thauera sp. SDU_THAU2]|uniref:DUF6531 domain-containing protein n=1 Tax=Thauera sp. SDU_THAU2 TaxID=3136633 RepID=UPI0031203D75
MSGKPAARVSDSVSKGVIVTGSATVLIGDAAEGKADRCPVCEPAVGAPVNPLLGVKLLPAETDFALSAPQPFVFARSYASNDMRVGMLGQGWSIPGEGVGLELSPAATVVIDGQGRRITFGALEPGEARFSPSERLWIRRGETASTPWEGRWAGVPEVLRRNPEAVFVLAGGQYFHFAPVAGTYRLHTQFDRNHYATQFGWLPDGLLAVVRDSAGRHYRFAYRYFGNEVRLAGVALTVPGQPWQGLLDADAQADWLVRYQYSGKGELLALFDRAGQHIRSFAWRHGRLVAHGRPDGLEVQYTWDAQGRVVQQREVDGLSRQYAYHADHTIVTDSLGRTETYHFEGEGADTRWTAYTRADGSTERFEYDGFGHRVARIDALERVTRERLDGQGRLVARILPDGSAWRYRLDEDSGEVLAIEGPEGLAWHIERDERANPLIVREPGGHETRYRYEDPRLPDRPTSIVSGGRERRLAWNALGQLTTHTDCSGHATRFSYDPEGRLVGVTNALGEATTYAYDSIGRLIVQTDAARQSTRYSYDALGRLITLERPDGKMERLAWDRFGRLSTFMDAGGLTQHYRYDQAGRLIELQNENGAVSGFAYDALDRLVAETGFDGRTQRYRYNLAGELIAHCEASLPDEPVTTYEHDKVGRPTRRHLPATAYAAAITETFHWRADGQLASFDSPAAQVRLGFDTAGRLSQEAQTHVDGWQYACAHRFDAAGRPGTLTLGDAPTVQWLTYGPGHVHGIRLDGMALDIERDVLHRAIERQVRTESGTDPVFTETHRYGERGQLRASRFVPALGPLGNAAIGTTCSACSSISTTMPAARSPMPTMPRAGSPPAGTGSSNTTTGSTLPATGSTLNTNQGAGPAAKNGHASCANASMIQGSTPSWSSARTRAALRAAWTIASTAWPVRATAMMGRVISSNNSGPTAPVLSWVTMAHIAWFN